MDDYCDALMNLPPIPEENILMQWQIYSDTIWHLANAGGLTRAGLEHVRADLRTGWWADDGGLPDRVASHRQLLLDGVSRMLAQTYGDAAEDVTEHYRHLGDVLPAAPADAQALDTGE